MGPGLAGEVPLRGMRAADGGEAIPWVHGEALELLEGKSVGMLPTVPGVYLFRDADGEILYVGKAKNLQRRVQSYFRARESLPVKTRALVRRARELEFRVVPTEHEALLLEARLIKVHRPRYNRRLKDGRSFPYLKIILQAPPRVLLTRQIVADGAVYFGPFPEPGMIRSALKVIRRLYTQRREAFERPHRHWVAADDRRMAAELLEQLDGRGHRVRDRMERAMHKAVEALDFERAARLREALVATEAMAQRPRARPDTAATDLPLA